MNALEIITKATQDILALPEFKEKAETLDSLSKIACKLILAEPQILDVEEDDIWEDEFHGGDGMESPFNG